MQLEIVISLVWGFHCLLLTQVNPRLINYKNKVRKLLSIVETLKDNSAPLYEGIVSQIQTTSHII